MTFDSLFRLWRRGRLARSGRARPTAQPRIEALEARWVPSTVTDNLTPAAPLVTASAPPAVAAPATAPSAALTTADASTAVVSTQPPQVLAATPVTTPAPVNPTVVTTGIAPLPAPVAVGTPVVTTPAPVNPTDTATPVPTPIAPTPNSSSTGTPTTSSTCTTTGGSNAGQTQTLPPATVGTPTFFNTGTSTTGSAPLLTIPEYYGGTLPNNTTLPPTITPPTAPSSPSTTTSGTGLVIGGNVYEDKNNNGILESGEPGIGNNQILLKDSSGNVIGTTTTNNNGQYQFTVNQTVNTTPQDQTQQVSFGMAPTNYVQTQSVQQFDPSKGTLNSVQIIEQGQLTSDIKVENLDSSASQITGTVSGQLSLSAPGLSNLTLNPTGTETNTLGAFDGTVDFAGTSGYDFGAQTAQKTQTVTLSAGTTDLSAWIGSGQVHLTQSAQATSSANGPGNVLSQISSAAGATVKVIYNYTPTNSLQPGTYTVVQPYNPPGYTPGQDTGDNHTPFPANGPPNTIPVTLTNNSSTNNNFGELKPSTLSGIAYLDSQRDGKYNSGDSIMPGVTIQLTNSQGTAVGAPQVTGSDGSYTFNNLAPGTYTITVVPPQGYASTGADPGSLGGTEGSSHNSITVTVPENAQGYNYDFGLAQPPASPPPSSPPGTPVPPPGNPGTPGTPTPTPSTPNTPATPVPTPTPATPATPSVPVGVPFSKRMFIGSSWGSLLNS